MQSLRKKLWIASTLAPFLFFVAVLPAQQPKQISRNWPVNASFLGQPAATATQTFEYQKIESQVYTLVREYHKAESEQRREEIRNEIQDLTEKQFEMKHAMRKKELERLRKQLESVESKVSRREELKQEIIDRRVADLTKEDAELSWEESGALLGTLVAPPTGASLFPQYSKLPSQTLLNNSPRPPAARPAGPTRAPLGQQSAPDIQPQTTTMTVAEARTRLEIAQRNLELVTAQHRQGTTAATELSKAEGTYSLAKVTYQLAQKEFEARRKLLEYEIDKAKLELDAAQTDFDRLTELHTAKAITDQEMRKARLAMDRAMLNLKSLQTYADLHNDTSGETESTSGNKKSR